MTLARTLATSTLLALLPASAALADNRAYVDSGQYLADVTTATAPATAWLLARTDTIARQSEVCRAAGFPLGGETLAPAAPNGLAVRGAAGVEPSAWAASRGATGAAPYGAARLTVDRASVVGRRFAKAKVGVRAVAPAWAEGRAVVLPVQKGALSAAKAEVWSAGSVRLVRGRRAVVLQAARVQVKGRRIVLVGSVGGTRMTFASGALPPTAKLATGTASVDAAAVSLTSTAAKAVAARLGIARLAAGRLGRIALRADLRRVEPRGPAAPVPAGAAPDTAPSASGGPRGGAAPIPGEPGLTVVPASRDACAATPARPALVLDLDETALSNYLGTWGDPNGGEAGQAGPAFFGQSTAMLPILDLYNKARARGVAVFFITARPGIIEAATRDNLRRVGYPDYEGLSFKNDLAAAKDAYKSARRAAVEARGYRIVLNVGDQQTDLDGGHAERAFKVPNPFY